MNWDDIRLFNAVAAARSIRGAALKLNISHSTVSRRIRELEQALATRLFQKLPDGYFLTETGERLFRASQNLNESFHGIERLALGRDTRLTGEIRLTLPDIFVKLLMGDFRAFAQKYPHVNLTLIPTYDILNLHHREADIALRVVAAPPENLVGRKLAAFTYAAYASREYIDKHTPVETSPQVSWVGWREHASEQTWLKASSLSDKPTRVCISNVLLQVEAAKSDLGICLLPCFLGDTEPSLRRIPDLKPQGPNSLWLLTHPDLRRNARMKLLMRFLTDAIRKYDPLLLGKCPLRS